MVAALRVVEVSLVAYRRTWRGSVFSSFVQPALYLVAIGLGLGSLVDAAGRGLPGRSYLAFLAPGLLVATTMQTAAQESSYPVFAGIKWRRTYHAALATPLRPRDLVLGHLGFTTLRVGLTGGAFLLVMTVVGAVSLGGALAAFPVAVLNGLAFAGLVMAYVCAIRGEQGLSGLFRFGILPLFLFSGTFFPVSQLPDAVEWIAWLSPLWHGVELARGLALPEAAPAAPLVHLAVLVVTAAVGARLAVVAFTRRLTP